ASAQAEVDRNLAQLQTQISEANQRLVDTVGQGPLWSSARRSRGRRRGPGRRLPDLRRGRRPGSRHDDDRPSIEARRRPGGGPHA
ncbi:hypothetical protein ABZZ80_45315, partial [Streptomyces sp. NPDC006356]